MVCEVGTLLILPTFGQSAIVVAHGSRQVSAQADRSICNRPRDKPVNLVSPRWQALVPRMLSISASGLRTQN